MKRSARTAAAIIAAMAVLVAMALGVLGLRSRRASDPQRIAAAITYTTKREKIPFRTTTVKDPSKKPGTIISKGVNGERIVRYAQAPGGKPVKYEEQVAIRPVNQVEAGDATSADVTKLDLPEGASPPPDGMGGSGNHGVPGMDKDGRASSTTDPGAIGVDDGTAIDNGSHGFFTSLVNGGVGTLDGHLVTWADPTVLGVTVEQMTAWGIRSEAPLTMDGDGVWHLSANQHVAVGAPADVPLGTVIATSIGTFEVVDHDTSGSWNVMTAWRSQHAG